MKKSIFLFFAAILCAMSAGAAQVTPNGKYFYFKTSSTWNVDNPRYSVYFAWRNGGGEDKTWASCKTVPGTTDILYVTAPGEFWDIYFCRMNGSTTDNKDANVWNKTDKLQYDGSKNFWTKSAGWNGTASYSIYVPAISSVTLLDNGTNIISGTGTQADPYLVYVETAIKVKGAGAKVLEDPDAKLNYKFKQGTTSKQEGTSATYQFTASATANTEYTINLEGYTKVNTTKSTVTKSATALYYKTVERAEETNTVTISYKCGDKDVQTGITEVVGVSTTSSFSAPTNITGYKFTNWTIGAGIDLKAGTASDATITVVTKSASSDYTLVANYEEVLETVYFINTNKWARVNIHKWDGKAADSSWPGEKLTASGEKIGEYDVYSYTAKQGDYANVIFNSKTSGTDGGNAQTADLTWTAGKYYIYNYGGKSDWYTKEEAEALLVVPVVTHDIVVKAVVPEAWNSGTISIHYWGDGISATANPVATEKEGNWNKYTIKEVPEGTSVSVIFINGANWSNNANQTANITGITEDKCFQISAAKLDSEGKCTVKEVDCDATIEPEVDVYTMMGAGELGLSWDLAKTGNDMTKQTDGTYTLVKEGLDLVTTGSYEYKVVKNHSWDWSIPTGNTNQTLKVDKAGTYTVTFTLSADKKNLTAVAVRNTRTVTVTAENGKVEGIENNGVYILGKEVTLTATANDHYVFVNWTAGEKVVSTENPYMFTVTADVDLVANFALDSHIVTATATNGTVTGDGTYEHGAEVTLTATAAEGYEFVNWTENEVEVSTDAEYTFDVLADHNLVANFKKKTYTITATAVNGTVTGLVEGGIYEHGATATLTATPAFDYQFVKWSNGATENPLTITVAENVTLEAIFEEVAVAEVEKPGVFSISAHKTATFATGNLQYNVGTDTWRFAKQQYQVVGEQNINLGDPAFTGWIDMLGWSTNDEGNNFGVNPSNVNELYDGEFVDWGTKMGEGWSTLSADEWKYLLNTRGNAASLKQIAKVGDILGLLLFPDAWVMPESIDVTAKLDTAYNVNVYNYTVAQWEALEDAGAIFLPAAGRRTGGYGNMINYDQVEETNEEMLNGGYYRHQDNTNIYCYYWTSTINEETKNVSYLHNIVALGNEKYTIGTGAIWGEKGRYGQSVRLAKVAYDKHTVTAIAENGTVTGADTTYTHGTEVTLTATANEHYVFVNWTKGEEVVAETAEYTFTVEADVELVANFKLDSHTVAATAENGTVTGLVEGGKYEHGATATLTATPDEGYEFVNWTAGKDTVSTEATYTFTVEADVNLVANFKKQIVHTAITAEDAIVRLIDGVLYFNGVLEDGTPYQVTLNEYTEVGDYTNISWTTYGEDEVEVVGAQANVNGEEGKLTLTATVANETNSYGLTISGILPAAEEDVKEVESLVYTLTPATGTNNAYAGSCDITIEGITWNLTGNSTMQPWRIGGKKLTNQDRALYSKTPLAYNISKIDVTHGAASGITVNSFKLIISDEADGIGETIDVAFKANATTTIDLPEGDYTNKYFKFVYNVTVGNDNKYVQFTGAKFYATTTIEANPAPEAPAFTGEANFVGSTEVELTTTEENINIYYTLTNDYTLPTAGYMYAESIEVTETTTVKAIAHNTLTGKISEIAEKTFTKAELYTITWSVNGEVSETTEVVQGNTLTLPADPTAPEACGSKVFMGWATTSSVKANGTDITYVDNKTIPTDDATYYAVFAKTSISDSSEDKKVTLSIKEYAAANGWVNGTKYTSVVVDENVTATVSSKGSNTGKYYTSGYEWRIYQSETATLTIAAKEGCMLKAINVTYNVSNNGTLLDAPSKEEVEVEAESVTFKVGNTGTATNGQVKITAMTITYNAGETYTYSEYSTTCSGTGTDVENIEVKGKSVKMIVNGQLIIIKNGVTYNAQGQVVK